MQDQVKNWLKDGTIDIFIGYKTCHGHPLPHCFDKAHLHEVNQLVDGPARYALEKIAAHLTAHHPGIKIGMLARDCNQRALKVLTQLNALDDGSVKTIALNCCPSNLKTHADCSYLQRRPAGAYKKQVGIDSNTPLEDLAAVAPQERLSRWMYEFEKCIKCYGCRNICPVCCCEDCSLEHAELIGPGRLPPDVPLFHLVRAVHMAGRCIDCGLCEDACPADIPLRLLYREVNAIFKNLFDYTAGVSGDPSPFNMIGEYKPLN